MMKSRRKTKKNKDKNKVSYSLECNFLGHSAFLKVVVVLVVISINWTGISAIGRTLAYFNDVEDSLENIYQAGTLDFSLTNSTLNESMGLNEEVSLGSVLMNNGGFDFQYILTLEKVSGSDNFCNNLELEARLNGIKKYDSDLMSFDVPVLNTLGSWSFRIELPVTATNISHGEDCEVDLIFKGWQTDIANYEDNGFSDEERIHLNFTSKMMVLNEFLPNPDELAWGLDFGDDNDSMPDGEWVEIYNNSDQDYNLDGWYLWDASNDDLNKIFVTNSNTDLGTTVISGNSWLVVYMNKEILDNTSDTVSLFDENNVLIDSYSYADNNDYCKLDPTPGSENDNNSNGSCLGVPPNKSYARIPDGIGYWVDPIPTPGGANTLKSFEYPVSDVSEPEIIIELPDIDIIETTTPALEEVTVIEEEPAEELEEVRPLENSDEEVARGRTSTEAEEIVIEEPESELNNNTDEEE